MLVTPGVGSSTAGITGGSLTASGGTGDLGNDLVVNQFNTTTPFSIGASITNSGTTSIGLTKAGPGTLVLIGSNSYSGPTTVGAGTLQGSVGAGSFGNTSGIAVSSGANLVFAENSVSPVTAKFPITGAGTLTKTGSGTLTSSGGVPSGGLNVVGGTFNLGGSLVTNAPMAVGTGGTLAMAPSPGLAVSIYRGDPGNNFNGYTGTGFPATGTQQLLFNTQAGVSTFTSGLAQVFSGNTAADGNTMLNFNGPNGANGQAFNGTNGPGNIGYTDANGGNDYTVVLTGYINLPAGTSNFTTRSDDGSMLFIDGQAVVNNNGYQGMTNRSGSIVEATAGASDRGRLLPGSRRCRLGGLLRPHRHECDCQRHRRGPGLQPV